MSINKLKKVKILELLLFYTLFFSSNTKAIDLPNVIRLSGSNRYETSAEICKYGWKQSEYAVIVSSENYIDALCATTLAYEYRAPMLFNEKDKLNKNIEMQLLKLRVNKVFIIAGEESISPKVDLRLRELNIESERIYGMDRTETSIMVAKKIGSINKFIVTSDQDITDMLSITPILAKNGVAILIINVNNEIEEVQRFLNENPNAKITIICGENNKTEKKLSKFIDFKDIDNKVKYQTVLSIKKELLNEVDSKELFFVSDKDFSGVLSSTVIAALNKSVIIITNARMDKNLEKYVVGQTKRIEKIIIIGGYGCIPDSTIHDIYRRIGAYDLINTKKYIMEKVISIKNIGNDIITDVQTEIDVGTLNNSTYQQDDDLEVYGKNINLIRDKDENYKAIVNIPYLKQGQSEEFKVIRKLNNSGIKYNINIKNTNGDYRGFKEYERYTSAETEIESDNILIISKAKELTINEINPYNKAKIIYEFVNTKLIYDASEGNKGALNAIISRKGVCEDFAKLFTAMCRSVGIPSRVVYGNWIPLENISSKVFDITDNGHVWAEFYLPEYGWVIVEPTKQLNDSTGKIIANFDYFSGLPIGDHFLEYYNKPKPNSQLTINKNEFLKNKKKKIIKIEEKECYIREAKK